MPEEEVVSVKIIELISIKEKIEEHYVLASSSIKDHYLDTYTFGSSDLTTILELNISCILLLNYVADLIQRAAEQDSLEVDLGVEELGLVSALVGSVNLAFSSNLLCGSNFLLH